VTAAAPCPQRLWITGDLSTRVSTEIRSFIHRFPVAVLWLLTGSSSEGGMSWLAEIEANEAGAGQP
jgi:hypothetical protein